MAEKNLSLANMKESYLFLEIAKRRANHLKKHPHAPLISLGIGDTTEPIPVHVAEAMAKRAMELSTNEGYQGYGSAFGPLELRERISNTIYQGAVSPDDIFISDGSKCDIGRLQFLFGSNCSIAVQDPAYPVYAAASLISGKGSVVLLPCLEENDFIPDIESSPKTDLIYLCSPHNPTGSPLTKEALEKVVRIAKERGSIIIYDTAYSSFIRQEGYPRSIFEIEGAQEVAIETSSLSKLAGFTGIRLGWTVVPSALKFSDGTPLQPHWKQIISSLFNGASHVSIAGALEVLTPQGLSQCRHIQDRYLNNAHLLKTALETLEFRTFGGANAPYLFVDIKKKSSWALFDHLLETAHLITTPGVGFGQYGEGYLRLSAFGSLENAKEAACRLAKSLI